MWRKSLHLILLVGSFSCGNHPIASAQESTIRERARSLLKAMVTPSGPGAVVLIAKADRIIYRDARGSANIELNVPLSATDTFRIASVSKMFTAAMILKLSEDGKLSLSDPLSKFIHTFPNGEEITIRELLNHTSGVSDTAQEFVPGLSRRDVDTATQVSAIAKRTPDFAPGTHWSYSNAGYVLLGAVIENVTGERWYDAIHEQLSVPLSLTHTMYGGSKPLISGRAAGYTTDSNSHAVTNANYISSSFPAAAGGLISTADDLFRWMRDVMLGHSINIRSLQEMLTPTSKLPGSHTNYGYGLGVYLWNVRGKTMIGHTGDIDGFSSAAGYIPEADVTVIVLANDDNFDARGALRRFAGIALGAPYLEASATVLSATQRRQLAGAYQVDPQTLLTLSDKDEKLSAQQGNGRTVPLQMTTAGRLHFVPDELTYFVPARDALGAIVGLNMFEGGDGPPRYLSRIKELPPQAGAFQPPQ